MVLSWTTVLRVGANSAENATMREDILVENAANMLKTRRLSDGILLGVQRLSLGTYGSTDWLGLRNTPEHFTIRPAKGKDNEAPAFPYYFLKESNLQHWCQLTLDPSFYRSSCPVTKQSLTTYTSHIDNEISPSSILLGVVNRILYSPQFAHKISCRRATEYSGFLALLLNKLLETPNALGLPSI